MTDKEWLAEKQQAITSMHADFAKWGNQLIAAGYDVYVNEKGTHHYAVVVKNKRSIILWYSRTKRMGDDVVTYANSVIDKGPFVDETDLVNYKKL